MKTAILPDLEFVKSGIWIDSKGKKVGVTNEDIETMFSNSQKLGFKPPLSLGHAQQKEFRESLKKQTKIDFPADGLPALGYPTPKRLVYNENGSISLWGDIEDVPEGAVSTLKNSFGNHSASILQSVTDGSNSNIGAVFGGLSMLGMQRPAILQLARSFSEYEKVDEDIVHFESNGADAVAVVKYYKYKDDQEEDTFHNKIVELSEKFPGKFNELKAAVKDAVSFKEVLTITSSSKLKKDNKPIQSDRSIDMEPIKVIVDNKEVILKTEADVLAFSESQTKIKLENYVKKEDYDKLIREEKDRQVAANKSSVESQFSELRNFKKEDQCFPPAVIDRLEKIVQSLPIGSGEIQFSESGKDDVPLGKALVDLVKDACDLGMVDMSEKIVGGNIDPNDDSSTLKLKADFAESKKQGMIDGDMTIEEYVEFLSE